MPAIEASIHELRAHDGLALPINVYLPKGRSGKLPVIVGCGADCEDVCEKGNEECDGEDADCSEFCSQAEDQAEKAGCESELDDVISCGDDADDICATDACDSETAAYGKCVLSYCTAHPTESVCGAG